MLVYKLIREMPLENCTTNEEPMVLRSKYTRIMHVCIEGSGFTCCLTR